MKRMGFLHLVLFLVACSCTAPHHSFARHAPPAVLNVRPFNLTEGPSWDGGDFVYFSEIYANRIHRYSLSQHTFEVVFQNSHAANGMAFDNAGRLWICEQDTGSIVVFNPETGNKETLVNRFNGAPFNHPNDLTLDSHGGAYFTDPAWDLKRHKKQPVNGVYYVNQHGETTLLISDNDKPNGILLDRQEQFLYVADMGNDSFKRYTVLQPGVLGDGDNFAKLDTTGVELAAPDGLEEDEQGNIYVAASNGLQVFSSDGAFLYRVALPQRPTNLEFVNPQQTQLLVTTNNNLYLLTRQ